MSAQQTPADTLREAVKVWRSTLERVLCPASLREVQHPYRPMAVADWPTLAAVSDELDAIKARRCENCQHSFVGMAPAGRPHNRLCKRTKVPLQALSSQAYVLCEVLGNTCGSWEVRRG